MKEVIENKERDRATARQLAQRYRYEFVDLKGIHLDLELFRSIQVDLMFRYNFVPLRVEGNALVVAMADPSDIVVIDEVSALLGRQLSIKVALLSEIQDLLKKSESSQRMLEEATEGFKLDLIREDESGEETITIEKITQGESSPIIRLVDTIIFTALERRASDIHIETRDTEVGVKYRTLSLDVVGFSDRDVKKFRRYISEPYGMVLVTGPTGSGKTTTLYAALMEIKNEEDKILTIEDPVEYQIRGITQIPVNEKKGLTFARGLRSILRHDPDKIMVGEIRDVETAQIAIQSALTGHLVFTTVHANNVVDVLGRFLNMGVDPYNFVSALNCILAQRLVRVICGNCRKPVRYGEQLLIESGLKPEQYRDFTFHEGEGCLDCNGTGYRGRTAIQELLDLSDHIREMIVERRPTSEIKRAAHDEGMTSLRESALEKALAGITTLKEINKVTFIG